MQHSQSLAKRQHAQVPVWIPVLVLLFAFLLRIGMLGVDVRFHPDEALFAAQARLITTQHDVLLRTTDLDKPPLTFYSMALTFKLLPVGEFTARLPNVFFSATSVALLYALMRVLYRDRVSAVVAMLLLAFSPYHLAFSATVFTDIQATFWMLAACNLVIRDRWIWAGMAAALMFAAKSTMLLFIPLILALGIATAIRCGWRGRNLTQRLWWFGMPLLAGVGLLLLWDMARVPRSFFELGYVRNNPGRLIRSDELVPRLGQWVHWLNYATGSYLFNTAALIVLPVWLLAEVRLRTYTALINWLIVGYCMAFVGWYWLIAFNTFDRYLYPLLPFVFVLGARMVVDIWRWFGARPQILLALLVVIVFAMSPGVHISLRGDAPLGGDQGQHTGIDDLAHYLNTELSGMIVYDHWLGWELSYYLGAEPAVSVRYVSLPEDLADDASTQTRSRYFVAPSPDDAIPWLAALRRVDMVSVPVFQDAQHDFVVYQLSPNLH